MTRLFYSSALPHATQLHEYFFKQFSFISPNDKNALSRHPGGHAVQPLSAVLPDDGIGRSCRSFNRVLPEIYCQALGTIFSVQQSLIIHSYSGLRVRTGWEGPSTVHASIVLWTLAFITTVPGTLSMLEVGLFCAPCPITRVVPVDLAFPKCKAGLILMTGCTTSAS